MKIVQINSVCGSGSTGKICVAVSRLLTQHGIENYILYGCGHSDYPLGRRYMTDFEIRFHAAKSKLLGNYGFQSRSATKRLLRELDSIAPDVVHLHNLHSHNVHLGLLFSYLKEKQIKVFWTFHDCWAFTAYCMYFDMVRCDKWKTECRNCPQRKKYSAFWDRSKGLYAKKKELFSGLNMTIITPSRWLGALVKESFLRDYPVKVIHNGIDLDTFAPKLSDFRKRYGISEGKRILLGVANKWEPRKGLDVFLQMAEVLDKDRFQIVLVGTSDVVDRLLPSGIISIHRTVNQAELAEIYSVADCFINPTREDNFPTVNIEALACGTPVFTYNTGGSPECITEANGLVVEQDDFDSLSSAIRSPNIHIKAENCVNSARKFNQNEIFLKYLELYDIYEHSEESHK